MLGGSKGDSERQPGARAPSGGSDLKRFTNRGLFGLQRAMTFTSMVICESPSIPFSKAL